MDFDQVHLGLVLAVGEYESTSLLPWLQAEARKELEDRIHLAYGRRLFAQASLSAPRCWGMWPTDLRVVLRGGGAPRRAHGAAAAAAGAAAHDPLRARSNSHPGERLYLFRLPFHALDHSVQGQYEGAMLNLGLSSLAGPVEVR